MVLLIPRTPRRPERTALYQLVVRHLEPFLAGRHGPLPRFGAFYRRQTKRLAARGKTGAIAFTQRFDSALRLNPHFHTLWPDGVLDCALSRADATFHEAPQPTQADIVRLVRTIETRVLRRLRRCGRWTDLDGADASTLDPSLFDTMRAAAILGISALGPRQGHSDLRLRQDAPGSDFDRGKLCADSDGFSSTAVCASIPATGSEWRRCG